MCDLFFKTDQYENRISLGELEYNKIDDLHTFLKLYRPHAHCVVGNDSTKGILLLYMAFSPNNVFNIENQPLLSISFTHNHKDAIEWIHTLQHIHNVLAKRGLLKKLKNDLPTKLICCLTIIMPMDDLLLNCFELLQYQ